MIQNVLKEIGGIAGYGVISICLFFVVFSTAMVWALLLKKPYLKAMESLPLELDLEDAQAKLKGDL